MKKLLLMYKAQSVETLIILCLCVLIYFILYVYSKGIKNVRIKERFISRAKFVILSFFIIMMFFIWIPRFWSFIAVLGFVAGAFVITQKHNMENLIGYFIISWRSLFVVGDIVKITSHFGKIKSLGLFYFTIKGLQEDNFKCATGNIIKIPNGYISKHPLINYSDSRFQLHTSTYLVDRSIKMDQLEQYIDTILKKIRQGVENDLNLRRKDIFTVDVKYTIKQGSNTGINLTLLIRAKQDLLEHVHALFDEQLLLLEKKNKIKLL